LQSFYRTRDAPETNWLDEAFLDQVRFPQELRGGVSIETYLEKMDRAGIQRSLLVAVRAGDLRVTGSFEIPYECALALTG
jgi:hypothetical protein